MKEYITIEHRYEEEYIINKSRFIGYACPVTTQEEAVEFINEIRKKHSDATHNVYAYVIDENGNASFIQAQNDYALEATIGEDTFTKVTFDLVKANLVPVTPDAILPDNDEE